MGRHRGRPSNEDRHYCDLQLKRLTAGSYPSGEMKLMRRTVVFLISAATLFLCGCEELPPQVQQPLSAILPMPTPVGWWNDHDISGSPRIVVRIGEIGRAH